MRANLRPRLDGHVITRHSTKATPLPTRPTTRSRRTRDRALTTSPLPNTDPAPSTVSTNALLAQPEPVTPGTSLITTSKTPVPPLVKLAKTRSRRRSSSPRPNKMTRSEDMLVLAHGKLPIIRAGDLTPSVLSQAEKACRSYFKQKEIEDDKQVAYCLEIFEDPMIDSYLTSEESRLAELTLAQFFTDIADTFLPATWKDNVQTDLLGAFMPPTGLFMEYATQVFAFNAQLAKVEAGYGAKELRPVLEAGMNAGLRLLYKKDQKAKAMATEDQKQLTGWVREVKRIDEERLADIRVQREIFEQMQAEKDSQRREQRDKHRAYSEVDDRQAKRPFGPSSKTNSNTSSQTTRRLPKLTEEEREIIRSNNGCTICRKLFVGDKHEKCEAWPNPSTYTPITEHSVLAAKAVRAQNNAKGKGKAVAVVMPVADVDESSFESENSLDCP
ncbi:unnamed protein product [Mycena citricolor]|uniref:Uncharacterized protein n=1 Tax=Mycena citricolor TaxID=2018698 RepID=A0AAD2GZG5_9AGAR|nr:unnamed protein product [Mycena citricolor]